MAITGEFVNTEERPFVLVARDAHKNKLIDACSKELNVFRAFFKTRPKNNQEETDKCFFKCLK